MIVSTSDHKTINITTCEFLEKISSSEKISLNATYDDLRILFDKTTIWENYDVNTLMRLFAISDFLQCEQLCEKISFVIFSILYSTNRT